MKRLLLILILTLSFQLWTKADDIKDFQIEGMSIGDSLLDYFNKEEILKYGDNPYNSDIWTTYSDMFKSSSTYDGFQVTFKKDDYQYKIESVVGQLLYEKNIDKCYKKKKEIILELDEIFINAKKVNHKKNHSGDPTGNSKNEFTNYTLETGDNIRVACVDWSNDMEYIDKLKVSISSSKFIYFIENEAYK